VAGAYVPSFRLVAAVHAMDGLGDLPPAGCCVGLTECQQILRPFLGFARGALAMIYDHAARRSSHVVGF
jgi:hypothetical protein